VQASNPFIYSFIEADCKYSKKLQKIGYWWTIPIKIPFRNKRFVFSETSEPVLGLIQPRVQNVNGRPFMEVKWSGREIYP
jgi:hypothetical protein